MYSMIKRNYFTDPERHFPYGICTPSGTFMEDLTPDRARIARFTAQLNHGHASELHICELVDDFIVEPLLP